MCVPYIFVCFLCENLFTIVFCCLIATVHLYPLCFLSFCDNLMCSILFGFFFVLLYSHPFPLPIILSAVVAGLVFVSPALISSQFLPAIEIFYFIDFRDSYVFLELPLIALNFLSCLTLVLVHPKLFVLG